MSNIIGHSGVVEQVETDSVFVRIAAADACGNCRAHEVCGMGEAREKVIIVKTLSAADYAPGDIVEVGVQRRMGAAAVGLAYAGALVVLLAVLVVAIRVIGLGEGISALVSLAGVGVYYGCLWLGRHKIETNIHFTITKL